MGKYDKWLISPDLGEEIIKLIIKYDISIDLLLYKTSLSNYFNVKYTIENFLIKVMSKKDKYESVMYSIKPIASILNILIDELGLNDEGIQDKKKLLNKIKNDKIIYYFEDKKKSDILKKFNEYKKLIGCKNISEEEYGNLFLNGLDNFILNANNIGKIYFYDNNSFYLSEKIKEEDNKKLLKNMKDEVNNNFVITKNNKNIDYNKILLRDKIDRLENSKIFFKDGVTIALTPSENMCINFFFKNNIYDANLKDIYGEVDKVNVKDNFSKFKTRLNKKISKYFKLKKIKGEDKYYLGE